MSMCLYVFMCVCLVYEKVGDVVLTNIFNLLDRNSDGVISHLEFSQSVEQVILHTRSAGAAVGQSCDTGTTDSDDIHRSTQQSSNRIITNHTSLDSFTSVSQEAMSSSVSLNNMSMSHMNDMDDELDPQQHVHFTIQGSSSSSSSSSSLSIEESIYEALSREKEIIDDSNRVII